MATKIPPPDWAYRSATPADREAVIQAHNKGVMRTNWLEAKELKGWARKQGWRTPLFTFESRFYETMLENDANFALAVSDSGLQVSIPIAEYTISPVELNEFDALYKDSKDWRLLVWALRHVRRAIEVGVVIRVEDTRLNSIGSFYNWAHSRYHMLEDGVDDWILSD